MSWRMADKGPGAAGEGTWSAWSPAPVGKLGMEPGAWPRGKLGRVSVYSVCMACAMRGGYGMDCRELHEMQGDEAHEVGIQRGWMSPLHGGTT